MSLRAILPALIVVLLGLLMERAFVGPADTRPLFAGLLTLALLTLIGLLLASIRADGRASRR